MKKTIAAIFGKRSAFSWLLRERVTQTRRHALVTATTLVEAFARIRRPRFPGMSARIAVGMRAPLTTSEPSGATGGTSDEPKSGFNGPSVLGKLIAIWTL